MGWLVLALAALPLVGLVYQWLGERRDARRQPPPGRFAGGLHVRVTGRGGPPVLLEAGIAASSVSWRLVERELEQSTTVVAYDRAGFGWSPAASTPRTMANLVEELTRMLEQCGVEGPFVVVAHSFGGLLARHFAAAHPGLVRALVLVDPLEPCEWNPLAAEKARRLEAGVRLSRRGALLARFGLVRLGLDLLAGGARVLPKLLARATGGEGRSLPDRLVGEIRKLPPEAWPAVRSHWSLPRSFRTMAEYLARLPEYCALRVAASAVPVTVLSAGSTAPEVREAHRRTAEASGGGHVLASASGHWIQLDQPGLVVEAVRRRAGL